MVYLFLPTKNIFAELLLCILLVFCIRKYYICIEIKISKTILIANLPVKTLIYSFGYIIRRMTYTYNYRDIAS